MPFSRKFLFQDRVSTLSAGMALLFGSFGEDDSSALPEAPASRDSGRGSANGDWLSNSETSRVKEYYEGHLQPVVNPAILNGAFVEFTLGARLSEQKKVFARIDQAVRDKQDNVIRYELQVPNLKQRPIPKEIVAKDLQNPFFFYFAFPILMVDTEKQLFPDYLANEPKMDEDYGFILRESRSEYLLQSYPTHNRKKLPWLIVISSPFIRDMYNESQRKDAKAFMARMVVGDFRMIINFMPGAGYPLRDFLELDVDEEQYVKDAHNLERLFAYLRRNFREMFHKPVGELFSKQWRKNG